MAEASANRRYRVTAKSMNFAVRYLGARPRYVTYHLCASISLSEEWRKDKYLLNRVVVKIK